LLSLLKVFTKTTFTLSLASCFLGISKKPTKILFHQLVIKTWNEIIDEVSLGKDVPWFRRLVAVLSPRRPEFDFVSVHVGLVVVLGRIFPWSTSVFPCQFHSTGAPLHGKTEKLIIFTTGLHNKPQGFSGSVASAAGPFTTKNYGERINDPYTGKCRHCQC
jgi:hypothetical protein